MFPFIPRKVSRPTKASISQQQPHPAVAQKEPAEMQRVNELSVAADTKGKGKATKSDLAEEDYAILTILSLSEHALWADPELRRTMDFNAEGYIPLSYLLHHSPYLSKLSPLPSEVSLVKAIRAHAGDHLDVRVLVSAPSRAPWYGRTAVKEDSGGFEVRRKSEGCPVHVVENWSRHDWDARTIYMECIPPHHRSIPGIWRLTRTLLSSSSPSTWAVQVITLPPHHQDKETDQPKCKGFALVTFAELEDVTYILGHWPWDRQPAGQDLDGEEAFKYGFRTLSKPKWQALNEEYLSYRKRLLEEIAENEDEEVPTPRETHAEREPTPQQDGPDTSHPALPNVTLSSPYPPGCLVFVRNVHPETNKTTLRTLFSQAYVLDSVSLEAGADALDYVDFNKGMDTCYLRLATPQHAQILVDYLQSNRKKQTSGLDSKGAEAPPADKKSFAAELVEGTREELYWAKVPEKVRRQAVEKALARSSSDSWSELPAKAVALHGAPDSGERKRKRKRRKRDA
ncbi:hypothetical protein OBBRIDRAFT_631030 [Obba rivulosa]|uniref:XRRM domain-containing protein n=1 Tax=Obba rivulosa TaxID=1052685 RepID=A0A8E2AS62_9APHY|nr:hypothetical protein OBBRIDRAFT_631030 [Obba rivulosa]